MDSLSSILQSLRDALGASPLAQRVVLVEPSHEQLREEILTGPLATELAPHWEKTFAPPDPDPVVESDDPLVQQKAQWTRESNARKAQRTGQLTSDGAHDIATILNRSGRATQRGWIVAPHHVIAAHNDLRESR
jgi:hypothetical protein